PHSLAQPPLHRNPSKSLYRGPQAGPSHEGHKALTGFSQPGRRRSTRQPRRKENTMNDKPWKVPRTLAAAAVAIGVAGGSHGTAPGARGSGGSPGSGSSSTATPAATPSAAAPWGHQRSDETELTGDTASKVRELALAKVPGGTVVRVEADADGHAA